jgi:renalase
MHEVKKLNAVVVGGGMSGVSAARRLKEAGLLVRVVDKGVSLGGRMATRRVAGGLADHGAQFKKKKVRKKKK